MFSYITAADSVQGCMMSGPGQFNPLLISPSVKDLYTGIVLLSGSKYLMLLAD
jgi:hypothetical protein